MPGTSRLKARHPHESLASSLAGDLMQRIERGELNPGSKLPSERELMASYGVSRSVVREATSSLRSAGRVSTQQGRGAFVLAKAGPSSRPLSDAPARATSQRTPIELLEVRLGLEVQAASLAARRRTPESLLAIEHAWQSLSIVLEGGGSNVSRKDREFHAAIARGTQNPYFADTLSSLVQLRPERTQRQFSSEAARKAHMQQVRAEHEQIFLAIARGDADSAAAAMHLHLANSLQRLSQGMPADVVDSKPVRKGNHS
ncbi:FadR/GntR family transcriptional regulator [Uliginosibacterium sediminicola]|uniref:FadR/GntR family transcriptional regulator n=1 Tax=Uliginosibacterium sediminicola TaxID=2024550 RepID=A0ABU9YWG0_9RHOO